MVEVTISVRERQHQPVGELDAVAAAGHAKPDVLQRSRLARARRLEERQLSAPSVPPDQREPVGPLDHVHAELLHGEIGDHVALRDPERDVIE